MLCGPWLCACACVHVCVRACVCALRAHAARTHQHAYTQCTGVCVCARMRTRCHILNRHWSLGTSGKVDTSFVSERGPCLQDTRKDTISCPAILVSPTSNVTERHDSPPCSARFRGLSNVFMFQFVSLYIILSARVFASLSYGPTRIFGKILGSFSISPSK